MPFQFGTVFSQAMQNALAAENQKKKDVFDYNMNIDKLNLDKWNSYNSLNLDAYRANQEGKRWGEEMKLKVDDTNWNRQFETQKWNTGLDLEKAKNFFIPDRNVYQQAYGMPFGGTPTPGTGGLFSINEYNAFQKPIGETFRASIENDKQLANQRLITGMNNASNEKISNMRIAADKEMFNATTAEERKRIQDNLDVKANGTLMVLLDEKGDLMNKVNPANYEDMKQLQRMGYITYDVWGGALNGTLKNMPSPIKKTKYPGTKDAIRNAMTGSPDN